jgi:hypothetical protein
VEFPAREHPQRTGERYAQHLISRDRTVGSLQDGLCFGFERLETARSKVIVTQGVDARQEVPAAAGIVDNSGSCSHAILSRKLFHCRRPGKPAGPLSPILGLFKPFIAVLQSNTILCRAAFPLS